MKKKLLLIARRLWSIVYDRDNAYVALLTIGLVFNGLLTVLISVVAGDYKESLILSEQHIECLENYIRNNDVEPVDVIDTYTDYHNNYTGH